MATVLIFHEVDDLQHWLASPKREETLGPLGIAVRTFVDPTNANRVGLLVETSDMATFQNAMASEAAADSMSVDGVRPDTVVILVES